jgi:hypothetical protein
MEPSAAAVDYIAENLRRPSLNTLPPNAANAAPVTDISF